MTVATTPTPTPTTPETPAAPAAPVAPGAAPGAGTIPGSPAPSAAAPPTTSPTAPAAPPAGAPAVPEAYTLTVPDQAKLEASAVERTAALAKALGLSNDGAQKLLDAHHAEVVQYERTQAAAWDRQVAAWGQAIQTDPELGGAAYAANLQAADRFFARFGSPALQKILDATGLAKNPEWLRLAVRAGTAMGHDTFVAPNAAGPAGGRKSTAEVLFDHPTSHPAPGTPGAAGGTA